jgi:transposase
MSSRNGTRGPDPWKRPRPRKTTHGRSLRDRLVFCELARTGCHRVQLVAASSDKTLTLRALVPARKDLVEARVALANQLRVQLEAFWPGAKQSFADVDIGGDAIGCGQDHPHVCRILGRAWTLARQLTPGG